MLKLQMALEDNFRDIAEKCSLSEGRHAVLLMDRGTMDVLAYVGKDAFDDVLTAASRGLSEIVLASISRCHFRFRAHFTRRSSRSSIGRSRNSEIKDMKP